MYFWKTKSLAEDIKNNTLSDEDWKNYYLAGSLFITISMYLIMLGGAAEDTSAMLIEAIVMIGIVIFGIQVTYSTNNTGTGTAENYISRMTALSFPLMIKISILSVVLIVILGVFSEVMSIPELIASWFLNILSALVQVLFFWRLNEHLKSINAV